MRLLMQAIFFYMHSALAVCVCVCVRVRAPDQTGRYDQPLITQPEAVEQWGRYLQLPALHNQAIYSLE